MNGFTLITGATGGLGGAFAQVLFERGEPLILTGRSEEKLSSFKQELLRQKEKELGRLPRKDDFDEATRSRIKAFLGPWPRALEAAGLKEARILPPKSKKRKKAATKSKTQAISAKQKLERRRARSNEKRTSLEK